jgi:hypothetical protein
MAVLPSLVRLTPASRRLPQPMRLDAGISRLEPGAGWQLAAETTVTSSTGRVRLDLTTASWGRPGHRPRSPHLDGQDHRHRPPRRRRADGVSHGASDAGQPCPPGAAITRDPSRGSHLRGRRADPVRTPIPARQEALVAEAQKLRTVQPAVGTDASTTPQPGRPESQQAESSTCQYDSPRTERRP